MAYLDLQLGAPSPSLCRRTSAPIFKPPSSLSNAEWMVLRLSRRDPLGSLAPAGPLRRLGRLLFGPSGCKALADPRLEALRAYAVTLRQLGRQRITSDVAQRVAAAFTAVQLAEVHAIVAREAPAAAPEPIRRRWASMAPIAAMALQATLQRYIAIYLISGPVGVIAELSASASVTPLLRPQQRSNIPVGTNAIV